MAKGLCVIRYTVEQQKFWRKNNFFRKLFYKNIPICCDCKIEELMTKPLYRMDTKDKEDRRWRCGKHFNKYRHNIMITNNLNGENSPSWTWLEEFGNRFDVREED